MKNLIQIFIIYLLTWAPLSAQLIENGSFEDDVNCSLCDGSANGQEFFYGCLGDNWQSASGSPDINCTWGAADGSNFAYTYVALDSDQEVYGESFFYSFPFYEGEVYTLSFAWKRSSWIPPWVNEYPNFDIKLANGLTNITENVPLPVYQEIDDFEVVFTHEGSVADGEWVYETITFEPSQDYSQLYIHPYFNAVEVSEFVHAYFRFDAFDLSHTCVNQSYFPQPEYCVVGDEVEITVTTSYSNRHHSWHVYIDSNGGPGNCNPNVGGLPSPTVNSGIQGPDDYSWTFTLPYVPNQCIYIKHGHWLPRHKCWREFRRGLVMPDITTINADFSITSFNNYPPNFDITFWPIGPGSSTPVTQTWTLETSESLEGPWNLSYGPFHSNGVGFANFPNTMVYRICHTVEPIEFNDICVMDEVCKIFVVDEFGLTVYDEDGNIIYIILLEGGAGTGSGTGGFNGNGSLGLVTELSSNVIGDIMIYPNPAADRLTVDMNGNSIANEGFELQLYNANGQLVLQRKFDPKTHNTEILTIDLPNGYYIIRLIGDQGSIIQKKVIVNH